MIHTFPDAREIVVAVRDWLREDVVTNPDPATSFQARVAANLLTALERELEDDGAVAARFAEALAAHGAESEAELALLLRRGDLAADTALVALLTEVTTARLRVSNPRHLDVGLDDDPRQT